MMNFPTLEQATAAAIECATRTGVEVSLYEQVYPLAPRDGLPEFLRYEVNLTEGSPPDMYAYRRIARYQGDQLTPCDEQLYANGDTRIEQYRSYTQ